MLIEELPHVLAYAQNDAVELWKTGHSQWDTFYAAHSPVTDAEGRHVVISEIADTKKGREANRFRASFLGHCLATLDERKSAKIAAITETRPAVIDNRLTLMVGIFLLNSATMVVYEMSKDGTVGKLLKIQHSTVSNGRRLVHHFSPVINI
jgi:hypothetical protein